MKNQSASWAAGIPHGTNDHWVGGQDDRIHLTRRHHRWRTRWLCLVLACFVASCPQAKSMRWNWPIRINVYLFDQVSMFDMGMRPNASNGSPGHTYMFYTGTPFTLLVMVFPTPSSPFLQANPTSNHLLSSFGQFLRGQHLLPGNPKLSDITITNTGQQTSDVLAYMTPKHWKEWKSFEIPFWVHPYPLHGPGYETNSYLSLYGAWSA